jgi:DNA invertase Pin-like site-specific DNA recombinase
MPTGKFVSYVRVSTIRQGQSGLGLDAQRKAISDYLNGGSWELLGEYVEIESGKNNDRQELQQALQLCRMTGATLIIAKLDRLSRNLHFISSLQQSNIEFLACDMPTANRFTVHILAAVAQHEREMISARTKAALQAAKARGTVLGTPGNLTSDGVRRGCRNSAIFRKKKAYEFAAQLASVIQEFQIRGLRLQQKNLTQEIFSPRPAKPTDGLLQRCVM